MSHMIHHSLLSKDQFASTIAYTSTRALHSLVQVSSEVFWAPSLSRKIIEEDKKLARCTSLAELFQHVQSKESDPGISNLATQCSLLLDSRSIANSMENCGHTGTFDEMKLEAGMGTTPEVSEDHNVNQEESKMSRCSSQGSRADSTKQPNGDPSVSNAAYRASNDAMKLLYPSFTLLALLRHAVIGALRELSGLYIDFSRSLRFWLWAREHRFQYLFYQGFSLKNVVTPLGDLTMRQNSHIFSLRRLQRIIISLIGSLYLFLNGTNDYMHELQERIERYLPFTSSVNRSAELHDGTTKLYAHFRKTVQCVKSLIEIGFAELSQAPSTRGQDLERNELSSESETFEGENEEEHLGPWASKHTLNCGTATQSFRKTKSVVVLEQFLSVTSLLIKALADRAKAHIPPFVARYGRLLVVAPALLTMSLTVLLRFTPEEIIGILTRSFHTVRQLIQIYGVIPAKSIVQSLLYSRPGVDERLAAFQNEAQALAKIITDYHLDNVVGGKLPNDRLQQLQEKTYNALMRGDVDEEGFREINNHYRDSVRHPIRSLIFGHLPRILLIRMSIQSLEITRVVNGIDEVLESNQLNFQVMTIVPLLAASCLSIVWSWWTWRRTIGPVHHLMRQRWREAHRILNGEITVAHQFFYSKGKKPNVKSNATSRRHSLATSFFDGSPQMLRVAAVDPLDESHDQLDVNKTVRGGVRKDSTGLSDYEQGLLLLSIHEMRMCTMWFFSKYPLYNELLKDLEMLESTSLSRLNRLEVLKRMTVTHKFL